MKSVIMFVVKVKKKEIHRDFNPVYEQNVIEVMDVFNNAEPVSDEALKNKCQFESAMSDMNMFVWRSLAAPGLAR